MTEEVTPASVRLLMNRKVLASYRHRTAVARRLGISESELVALTYLAEGGLTPGELGRRLQLTSGGMTSLLQRLRRGGHIERRAHPSDRRSVVVSATQDVLDRIAELYAPLVAELDDLTAELSGHDREIVHRYLTRTVLASELQAERLVADAEAADVLPDDDATHLWA